MSEEVSELVDTVWSEKRETGDRRGGLRSDIEDMNHWYSGKTYFEDNLLCTYVLFSRQHAFLIVI